MRVLFQAFGYLNITPSQPAASCGCLSQLLLPQTAAQQRGWAARLRQPAEQWCWHLPEDTEGLEEAKELEDAERLHYAHNLLAVVWETMSGC